MTDHHALDDTAEAVRRIFARQIELALPAVAARVTEAAKSLAAKPSPYPLDSQRDVTLSALITGLNSWTERLKDELRNALDFGAATRYAKAIPSIGRGATEETLSLVDDSTIEYEILASRLALAMMDRVSWEFSDLRSRVLMLERRAEMDERDLLRPHVIARMAVEAWRDCTFAVTAWRELQPVLHDEISLLLEETYHEANRWLVEKGVMPEIDLRPLIRRTRSAVVASAGEATTAPFQEDASAYQGIPGAAPASGTQPGTGAGAVQAVPPDQRAQAVLDRLSGLVNGALTAPGDPEAGFPATTRQPMVSPGLSQAMQAAQGSWIQRPAAQGAAAVLYTAPLLLQEIELQKQDLKRAAATQEERTTIEIVALLFQNILTEDRLPSALRVWFARLQMPVLRVAVTEPDFFATLDHPARRLIDRMGACVMGFGREGPVVDEALEVEVKRIVQVVEAYPDTGRRVFQTVLNEFEKFLETYFREQNATSRKGVSLAQQLEQRETMAIQYTIELRRMLEQMPVQDGVRQFLFDVWADVLATVSVSQGPTSDLARDMKRTAADLIWSAGAKVTREDRADVLRRLPALLKALREGMSLAGLQSSRQEDLIKQLNASLTAGFTAKAAPIPQRQLHDMMEQLESLEEMMPDAEDVDIDESMIRDIPGSFDGDLEVVVEGGEGPIPSMVAWARELQVGSWYLLNHGGSERPVQLVWHGMRKQLSLFVAADGHCKLFQQNRLAAYLQAGLLQPAQDEELTIRATRVALDLLNAEPHRLQQ